MESNMAFLLLHKDRLTSCCASKQVKHFPARGTLKPLFGHSENKKQKKAKQKIWYADKNAGAKESISIAIVSAMLPAGAKSLPITGFGRIYKKKIFTRNPKLKAQCLKTEVWLSG